MSQLDLLEKPGVPDDYQVSDAKLMALKDKHAALVLCMNVSCLEDKEIYGPLGLDQAQFSRIKKGSMHFPPNLEDHLMNICGNEIPLRYDALKRGYGLTPLRSTLEERVVELEQLVADRDHDLETIKRFVRETS